MPDFTEHDLRHEATCRWATMRNKADSGWMWSELEICKIMAFHIYSDLIFQLTYKNHAHCFYMDKGNQPEN
jgi:hypothetical protein